jgi:hypothetical protein
MGLLLACLVAFAILPKSSARSAVENDTGEVPRLAVTVSLQTRPCIRLVLFLCNPTATGVGDRLWQQVAVSFSARFAQPGANAEYTTPLNQAPGESAPRCLGPACSVVMPGQSLGSWRTQPSSLAPSRRSGLLLDWIIPTMVRAERYRITDVDRCPPWANPRKRWPAEASIPMRSKLGAVSSMPKPGGCVPAERLEHGSSRPTRRISAFDPGKLLLLSTSPENSVLPIACGLMRRKLTITVYSVFCTA